MLARRYRLTSASDIATTLRSGRKLRVPGAVISLWKTSGESCPQVGLAVGKVVGNSVVRSRVSRVLRHGIAPLVGQLPPGTWIVIRALPGSEGVSSTDWTRRLATALGIAVPLNGSIEAPSTVTVDKPVDVLISLGDEFDG